MGLAMVLSGGGARAAWQAGVVKYLAEHWPALELPILCGVSAGALNAAYLGNHVAPLAEKAEALALRWSVLETEQVFRAELGWTLANLARWAAQLTCGGRLRLGPARSLVDASPLRALVCELLGDEAGVLTGVARNLDGGRLRALALTAAHYASGESVTWVQARAPVRWRRAHRRGLPAVLRVDHVLASAALPFFFPAVQVDGRWYGDGGLALTAPLSPAIHLGASRILALSTRHASAGEAPPVPEPYPPPGTVAGALLDALFLDVFDGDALNLERVNRLLRTAATGAGEQGLRPVRLLLLRPSRDLGLLAADYEPRLPRVFRYMMRGLGRGEPGAGGLTSMVLFQPDYLGRLVGLGYTDAHARRQALRAFLEG